MTSIDRPSWRIRRRIVLAVLTFCAAVTVYLIGWGRDDELRSTIASGVLFLAGSVVMAYVFGVVWNDTTAMRRQPRQPAYTPPPAAGERPPGMPQGE